MSQHIYLLNKYTKWYYNIVSRAQSRVICEKEYYEQHHIIPDSFFINRTRRGPAGWISGSPNDPLNLVKLTPREHFICHLLLTKMTTGAAKIRMTHAAWGMLVLENQHQSRHVCGSRMYETLRIKCINLRRGVPQSEEARRKNSESHKGRPPTKGMTGLKHSEETIRKMREARKMQVITEETKEKLRQINLNKSLEDRAKHKAACQNQPKASCIYCRAVMTAGPLARHHGDNCKLNPQRFSISQR